MSKTTLDYDPFLCEECSKYGYCIKKNRQKEEVIKEKKQVKVESVPINQIEEEFECEVF